MGFQFLGYILPLLLHLTMCIIAIDMLFAFTRLVFLGLTKSYSPYKCTINYFLPTFYGI